MKLAKGFSKMAHELLTGIVAFKKFVDSMDKLFDEKLESYKCLIALSKENKKLMALSKDHEALLEKYKEVAKKLETLEEM